MRLLSVDWDYFVPSIDHEFVESVRGAWIPYALGGGEAFPDTLLDGLWDSRAAALLADGQALPGTSGDEAAFWDRFQVDPAARLYFADSHAQAAHAAVRTGVTEVWNFDAHHDCGYEGAWDDPLRLGWVGCANWMSAYALGGAALRVRYPSWRLDALRREVAPLCPVERTSDDGRAILLTFDVVFVARSGAWTPPWLDERFDAFLAAAPVAQRVCLDHTWRTRELDAGWLAHLQELTSTRQPTLTPSPSARASLSKSV
jgi:hypothetical protein